MKILCLLYTVFVVFVALPDHSETPTVPSANTYTVLTYLVPFWDFTLRDNPYIYYNNYTDLPQEAHFYHKMKRISLVHTVVGGVAAAAAVPLYAPAALPLAGYWLYHVYVLDKSSHLKQKCEFNNRQDPHMENERFRTALQSNKGFLEYIPRWMSEPIVFALAGWFFVVVSIPFLQKRRLKVFIFTILLVVYAYSFFQNLTATNAQVDIRRENKLRELMFKCHVGRMSYWQKKKYQWLSWLGFVTDEYGYAINAECHTLEEKLAEVVYSFGDILCRTVWSAPHMLFSELLGSFWGLWWYDRYMLVIWTVVLILCCTAIKMGHITLGFAYAPYWTSGDKNTIQNIDL